MPAFAGGNSFFGPGTIGGEVRVFTRNAFTEGSITNLVVKVNLAYVISRGTLFLFRQVITFRNEADRLEAEVDRSEALASQAFQIARDRHLRIVEIEMPPVWGRDP